jgi:hypothetical protein
MLGYGFAIKTVNGKPANECRLGQQLEAAKRLVRSPALVIVSLPAFSDMTSRAQYYSRCFLLQLQHEICKSLVAMPANAALRCEYAHVLSRSRTDGPSPSPALVLMLGRQRPSPRGLSSSCRSSACLSLACPIAALASPPALRSRWPT